MHSSFVGANNLGWTPPNFKRCTSQHWQQSIITPYAGCYAPEHGPLPCPLLNEAKVRLNDSRALTFHRWPPSERECGAAVQRQPSPTWEGEEDTTRNRFHGPPEAPQGHARCRKRARRRRAPVHCSVRTETPSFTRSFEVEI